MREANLPHSIFVDCSASDEIAGRTVEILDSSISVVTPNKKAASGPAEFYHQARATAEKRNVKFFFETNVGAALPIIGSLRDLLNSGDQIYTIEAVLSGTISYLFNNYAGDVEFSDIVGAAFDRGLTEPDPREDLSGIDVGRKLLILARGDRDRLRARRYPCRRPRSQELQESKVRRRLFQGAPERKCIFCCQTR